MDSEQTYTPERCKGWVVDADRGIDRQCQRNGNIEGGRGQWYCRKHDPARLPDQLARLVRDGHTVDARRVAERRGVVLEAMVALAEGQAPPATQERWVKLTRYQYEALKKAVNMTAGRVDQREARLMAGAMAVVEQLSL